MNDIWLKGNRIARYKSSRLAKVPEINANEQVQLHTYDTPCPFCDAINPAHSIDGKFFINHQLACRECGVFFRPVVDPTKIELEVN